MTPDVGFQGRRYLVTGGAGFLGSALVRRLIRSGASVRVLDDGSRGSAARLSDVAGQFEYVEGDIRDAAVVSLACENIDAVCHLAFVNGTEFFYTRPELVLDVGIKGIVNVIDACIERAVPELLVMSSSEVYQAAASVPTDETVAMTIPDPLNPRYSYAAGKIMSEVLAINYGRRHFKRVTVIRPHNVYGADMGREHVIPQFVDRLVALASHSANPVPFPIQGTGQQTRSFVHVDDFTDGVMVVLARGEHLGIYNVGTSEEITINTLAHSVAQHVGRPIRIVAGPPADGGTNRRCPDISKVAALGYKPTRLLSDTLPGVVRWYLEHPVEKND